MRVKRAILILTAVFAAASADAKSDLVGSWFVNEKKDPITDKPEVTITTINPANQILRFYIRCEAGKPYLALSLPSYSFETEVEAEVALRIDRGDVTTSKWRSIPKSRFLTAGASEATYGRITRAQTIAVSVRTTDGAHFTYEFAVERTADAAKPLLSACPLTSAFKATAQ